MGAFFYGPVLAQLNAAARRRAATRMTLRMLAQIAPGPGDEQDSGHDGTAPIDAETLATWTRTMLAERRDPTTLRANGLWVTAADTAPVLAEAIESPDADHR